MVVPRALLTGSAGAVRWVATPVAVVGTPEAKIHAKRIRQLVDERAAAQRSIAAFGIVAVTRFFIAQNTRGVTGHAREAPESGFVDCENTKNG